MKTLARAAEPIRVLPGVFVLYSNEHRTKVLAASVIGIAIIALVDWQVRPNVSLGFLYFVPVVLASGFSSGWQVLAISGLCVFLREFFSPSPWETGVFTRLSVVWTVFSTSGLFVRELVHSRKRALEHAIDLADQVQRRQEAETHLQMIINSSPLSILAVDSDGTIQQANEAAHRLLGYEPQSLFGEPIRTFFTDLDNVPREGGALFRTMMECIGRRKDGTSFLTHTWFSTYQIAGRSWMAAIIVDASEELRDREGRSLESLATASRILLGSILHEVRNLSAAAAVAHTNLVRKLERSDDEDLKVLGTLVKGLESLTSSELRAASHRRVATTDVGNVLDELRVVVDSSASEAFVTIRWNVTGTIPMVRGDHHALLQVFLNLAQNSLRAMREASRKELNITASVQDSTVAVRFHDTGPGVIAPERLFQPFQLDSDGSGLGLYVSRAIVRSFAGDLCYEPVPQGSCFVVRLVSA